MIRLLQISATKCPSSACNFITQFVYKPHTRLVFLYRIVNFQGKCQMCMILLLFNTIFCNHSKMNVVTTTNNLLLFWVDFLLKLVLLPATLLHMCLLVLHCPSLDVTL